MSHKNSGFWIAKFQMRQITPKLDNKYEINKFSKCIFTKQSSRNYHPFKKNYTKRQVQIFSISQIVVLVVTNIAGVGL